jgi:HlyD family secretion protein
MERIDRPLDAAFVRRQNRKRVAAGVAGLSLALCAFVWGPALIRPSLRRDHVRTGKVERGPVEASITASGIVVPEVEQVLASPMDARVLKILRRPGDVLAKGDPIVQLDLSESILAVQKLERDLALKVNKQASTRLELEAKLNEIEGKREIKKLELESLRSQLARNKTLSGQGLISEDTLELSALAEAKAAVELRQLEADARSAEKATRTQIEGLDLEMATLRRERGQAEHQLDLATTKADRDGVLTWALSEEGAAIRKGDVIARLADLRSYRVDATVSDIHARRLAAGMPVAVRVGDDDTLQGTVSSVSPAVQNGAITLSVALEEKTSPRLRSRMRVDVLVITDRKERTLRVKRGPFVNGEGAQDVFVVRGDRAVKTPVEIGVVGFDYCEVARGLAEGDEVVLSDLRDYAHLAELRLR